MTPGQPSATALLVATSVVRAGRAHGLPEAAIDCAARAIEAARGRWPALARHRPGRWLIARVERLVMPGLAAHHCARKAWLWMRLRRPVVADGPVVFAGVGLDGLGRALKRHAPDAVVVETDHPYTLRLRRAVLGDADVVMQAAALPDDLHVVGAACASRRATLVLEGVLMYLPGRDVLRMLRRIASLPTPPRLLFSALDVPAPGGAGFHGRAWLAHRWLARRGEPFRWRVSPDRARRFLAGAGYGVTAHWNGTGFGEYVIEAEPVG